MSDNNNKKPLDLIRGEVKYIILIIVFVTGIIFNYLTVSSRVDANSYRLTKIENARAEAWNKYYNSCEKQLVCSQQMKEDIIKIKVRLGIEN